MNICVAYPNVKMPYNACNVSKSDDCEDRTAGADIAHVRKGGIPMAAISGIQTSGVSPSSYANQTQSSNASRATASTQQPSATLKDDTVKLSLAAHIKQMHLQGYSPAIIASQLGISVKQVSTYLPGLTQATAAASTSAAASSIQSKVEVPAPVQTASTK